MSTRLFLFILSIEFHRHQSCTKSTLSFPLGPKRRRKKTLRALFATLGYKYGLVPSTFASFPLHDCIFSGDTKQTKAIPPSSPQVLQEYHVLFPYPYPHYTLTHININNGCITGPIPILSSPYDGLHSHVLGHLVSDLQSRELRRRSGPNSSRLPYSVLLLLPIRHVDLVSTIAQTKWDLSRN